MNIVTQIDELIHRAQQFHVRGMFREAEIGYREALAKAPNHLHALFGLGTLAHQFGQNTAAIELLTRAAKIPGANSSVFNNLGEAYRALNRGDDAAAAFREAMKRDPNDAMPHNNLGIVECVRGRLHEAQELWQRAIELKPDYADAYNNLGNALLDLGRAQEAADIHRKTLQIQPVFPRAHSNLLRDLNHLDRIDGGMMRREHEAWWTQQIRGITPRNAWPNDRNPDRPLRVALVSADFREHSVAYFLEPWLANRDRAAVEVFLYAEVAAPDAISQRLVGYTGGWRQIIGLADEVVGTQLAADKIDVLIDLAGHTAANRMPLFAHKHVPVQATWLGYPFTTGSSQIDWRITDGLADPPGTESYHSEKLWRLPRCNWCYRPPADAPEVSSPPREKTGVVTFGSFNNYAKVNGRVLATWAKVLARVPGSRLLLKANALGDSHAQARVREAFAAAGVDPDRVTLRGRLPTTASHLGVYGEIDIALDTFPYNGTTTTCESLWMGVPVVAFAGHLHVERVGVSVLTNAGLPDLVAADEEAYVDLAVSLAEDAGRAAEYRRTMRERLRGSGLLDEKTYAADIDAAVRGMWRHWCLGAK